MPALLIDNSNKNNKKMNNIGNISFEYTINGISRKLTLVHNDAEIEK